MFTLSFVTDVHLSFVTYLPMHLDRIETRMFRQGCHRQAPGTTHGTTTGGGAQPPSKAPANGAAPLVLIPLAENEHEARLGRSGGRLLRRP